LDARERLSSEERHELLPLLLILLIMLTSACTGGDRCGFYTGWSRPLNGNPMLSARSPILSKWPMTV